MQIERLAFVAFPISDLGRASRFYADVLGGQLLQQAERWIDFDLGGITLRAYLHEGEYRRQHSGLQFLVADVDRASGSCRVLE